MSSYMNSFPLREPASAEGQPEVGLEIKYKYLSDSEKDNKYKNGVASDIKEWWLNNPGPKEPSGTQQKLPWIIFLKWISATNNHEDLKQNSIRLLF